MVSLAMKPPLLSPELRGAAALLGELLLEGDRLGAEQVRDVEGVGELFEGMDDDDVAAAHHACFNEQVFPYASVYLVDEAQCGGAIAQWADDRWAMLLGEDEERPAPQVTADHLGLQLMLLSRLPDDEARQLLAGFMRPWLPAFRAALTGQSGPWPQVIELVADVIDAGADALEAGDVTLLLPEPPALLADDKTGLKDIARYLLRPAWTGVFLSRSDLVALGRASDTPSGFGPRLHLLENLLISSAEYGDVQAFFDHIAALVTARLATMRDDTSTAPWRERGEATIALLEAMKARADEVAAS
jgi:TorA maturation chaperone TorD